MLAYWACTASGVRSMQAIVIGNGEARFGPRLHHMLRQAALVVCADGGAAHALTAGVHPRVIVGDSDSVDPAVLAHWQDRGVEVVRHPVAKDETDLELAITWSIDHGARDIALLAALGGRLDQTLANVLILALPWLQGVSLRLEEEQSTTMLLHGGAPPAIIQGTVGDTVSLLPLSETAVGVSTQNLRYPLRDEDLLRGPTRGVSNEMLGHTAQVSLREGLLLVVHLHQSTVEVAVDAGVDRGE